MDNLIAKLFPTMQFALISSISLLSAIGFIIRLCSGTLSILGAVMDMAIAVGGFILAVSSYREMREVYKSYSDK